jgi:hypothetical protein
MTKKVVGVFIAVFRAPVQACTSVWRVKNVVSESAVICAVYLAQCLQLKRLLGGTKSEQKETDCESSPPT